MNYAHDLVVNYKPNPYQFYEWKRSDEITYIKSILCIKVSNNTLKDFINNSVQVDNAFLNIIMNKTISNKQIKYACILFNEEIAVSFLFDEGGNVIRKSNLVYDEADDIVGRYYDSNILDIKYKVIKKSTYDSTKTRVENELIKYIGEASKNEDKIKYIYYECFNKYEDNYRKAHKKLIDSINNGDNNIIRKLTRITMLIKK